MLAAAATLSIATYFPRLGINAFGHFVWYLPTEVSITGNILVRGPYSLMNHSTAHQVHISKFKVRISLCKSAFRVEQVTVAGTAKLVGHDYMWLQVYRIVGCVVCTSASIQYKVI